MRNSKLQRLSALLLALSLSPSALVSASPSTLDLRDVHEAAHTFARRQYIEASGLEETYDYVIAGGGLAGLVLASRLSDSVNVQVLVLEAGMSGDAVKDGINAPAGAYYSSIVGTPYDWQHITVPQTNLANRTMYWPRGKILGGSSAMNAMYLVRPSDVEMDAWSDVNTEQDSKAAKNWNWNNMFKYMKKAENFNPPIASLAPTINITYSAENHGKGGPMQLGYPAVMINITANWTQSLVGAGISELTSPNGGTNIGGFITPSSINPSNWTRSYSRPAYIDSLPPRPNLHILSSANVNKFILGNEKDKSGNLYATQVEFGLGDKGSGGTKSVNVRREVVLAGGALGSPKILLHSGVGPKDVLDGAGVTQKLELPGVGQHLQDHLTAGVMWATPLETAGAIKDSNSDFSRTPEFLSFINDAVAFVNASRLFDGNEATFHDEIKRARDAAIANVPSTSPEVIEGYKLIHDTIVDKLWMQSKVGHVEMLMGLTSTGVVSIQSAIQHPLSTGRLWINSTNPYDEVLIDPQYFSHFADVVTMRQGLRTVRAVGAAFGPTFGEELVPGANVTTDEDIDRWLTNEGAGTQYHPASSCAMLPKSKGGVVDPNLRVYGLANVRVADASVFPFEFAAHLASATYGVAEQASDLLKADSYRVPGAPPNPNSAFSAGPAGLKTLATLGAVLYAVSAFLL